MIKTYFLAKLPKGAVQVQVQPGSPPTMLTVKTWGQGHEVKNKAPSAAHWGSEKIKIMFAMDTYP